MPELTSSYATWKSSMVTLLLAAVVMVTLLVNIIFLVVFVRSKRLRRPPNLFLLNLTIADLIGAVFWGLPAAAAAAQWSWPFNKPFCSFHVFVGFFCFGLNMYTLCAIALEKFLKIWFPSRHSDAFHVYTVTNLVVFSTWVAATVLAFMPLIGWGTIQFFDYQLQCMADFVESTSHLNFFFINVFCFPIMWMLIFYTLTFIRIRILQKKGQRQNGKIVLESKKGEPGESFAAKMRRQQEKFRFDRKQDEDSAPAPSNQKPEDDDKLYASDESDNDAYASDENEIYRDYEEYRVRKRERELARRRRKIFAFRQQYLFMAITMTVVSLIYAALWLPFFIISYTWVYDPDNAQESSYTAFALITFFGMCFKPFIYLFNKHIRTAVKQALRRNKAKKAPGAGAKYGANSCIDTSDGSRAGSREGTASRGACRGGDGSRPSSGGFQANDMTLQEYGDEVNL